MMHFSLIRVFKQDSIITSAETYPVVEDALLEGHLGITRELLLFQSSQKKFAVGSQKEGPCLIRVRRHPQLGFYEYFTELA